MRIALARHSPRVSLLNVGQGDAFRREGRLWVVDKVVGNVKKGKETSQKALALRDLHGTAKKELRIKNQSEKVDVLALHAVEGVVCGRSGKGRVLVQPADDDTLDELEVPLDFTSTYSHYVSQGATVLVRTAVDEDYDEVEVVGLVTPKSVVATVRSVEERAEQASDSGKAVAVLENGRKIKVPPHLEAGTEIVVRLPSEEYGGLAADQ